MQVRWRVLASNDEDRPTAIGYCMSDALKIALIVGSTRPNRFADVPAKWVAQGATGHPDIALETLDLRDWPLPFLEEPVSPVVSGGIFTNPVAERWRTTLGKFHGFIVVAAEYNHGPTAVLKNALDSALNEWKDKPISFVGYGGVGGARAIEQLRMNAAIADKED